MSLRRNSQLNRCLKCLVHHADCYCNQLDPIELRSKVSIIMYKKERFLTSNTAMLANTCLINSEIYLRGFEDSTIPSSFINEDNYEPLYLFPDEDAQELTPEFISQIKKPINLIVPDGTWRQAKKIHKREKAVSHVKKVKVTNSPKTIYPLRQQKYEYGLCTFEAISYALGIIENNKVQDKLMGQLKIMIEKHTKYRGYLKDRL